MLGRDFRNYLGEGLRSGDGLRLLLSAGITVQGIAMRDVVQVAPGLHRIRFASDAGAASRTRVTINGVDRGIIRGSELLVSAIPGTPLNVVLATAAAEDAFRVFSDRALVQWFGIEDAQRYIVRQVIDGEGESDVAEIRPNGLVYESWESGPLVDGRLYAFNVEAVHAFSQIRYPIATWVEFPVVTHPTATAGSITWASAGIGEVV